MDDGLRAARRGGSHTGGTRRQPDRTNLYSKLMPRFLDLFDETARKDAPIRRINVGVGGVLPEEFPPPTYTHTHKTTTT